MLVNMKCKNRDMSFTPCHFCAYNGNIDMMNCLMSNGASILIPNDQGVKALHVAVQGDQAAMTYYLAKTLGCDLEDKDTSGNTALHWAIFTGSENCTAFLLAMGANPNSTNNEKSTPLHISVKSIEEHGSLRNVKALLLDGSLRTIEDAEGKMPIDYVEEIGDTLLANDLIQILSQPRSWMCCLLKTPLMKLKRSPNVLIQFFLLLLLNYCGMFLWVYQYIPIYLFAVHTLIIGLVSEALSYQIIYWKSLIHL